MDLERLRENHLEAQVRHLFVQGRATLLHIVHHRRCLDLALPQLIIRWILLGELAVDVRSNASLGEAHVLIDFPLQPLCHELLNLKVRLVLPQELGEIVLVVFRIFFLLLLRQW